MKASIVAEERDLAGLLSSFEEVREGVDGEIKRAIGDLGEMMARLARYHFGLVDVDGRPANGRKGKMFRPILLVLTARGYKARTEDAVRAAAGIELIHNFSLIHDDLIDRDEMRHGRKTVWAAFGETEAILLGDALLSLGGALVVKACGQRADRAQEILSRAVNEMIEGQMMDVSLQGRMSSLEVALEVARLKTGALLGASLALGALIGGASEEEVGRLGEAGYLVGYAFQISDDVLGIWGDPALTGKPVYSDILAKKMSVPIALGVKEGGALKEKIEQIYALPSINLYLAQQVAQALEEEGVLKTCEEMVESYAAKAKEIFSRLSLDQKTSAALSALTDSLAKRRF